MLLRLIIVDKANCDTSLCPALWNTHIVVKNSEGKNIAELSPQLRNINDLWNLLNQGDGFKVEVYPLLKQWLLFEYQETRILKPAYSQALCGINQCSGVMEVTNNSPDGTWLELDVYHRCTQSKC